MVHCAPPEARANPVHALMAPPLSLKVALPVGVPDAPLALSVKVTDWPASDGFADEESARDALTFALSIAWVSVAEVLGLKFASPPYVAVSVCVPDASVLVEQLAVPPLRARLAQEPSAVPFSRTVTVPLGVPLAAVTFTMKVTGWPAADGLDEDVRVVVVASFTTWESAAEVAAL